jgi:hypothetical protein
MIVPWKSPIAAPAARAAAIAGTAGQPTFTDRLAMIAPASPLTAPTERSISPRSSTNTTPMEIVPTAAICSVRFVRLTAVRKRSCAIAKTVQMIASTIRTRSDPSSPCASF